jgi:hypothetical protein
LRRRERVEADDDDGSSEPSGCGKAGDINQQRVLTFGGD